MKGWIGGWITGPCKDLLAHTLTFDATNPDHGPERMAVECRSPSYSGQMSARCDAVRVVRVLSASASYKKKV